MGKNKDKKDLRAVVGGSPRLAQDKPKPPRLTILQADVPGKNIGEQLRTVRRELGLTLVQVANAVRENVFSLYQIEINPKRKIRPELLKKLSDLYNLRVGVFLLRLGLEIKPIIR